MQQISGYLKRFSGLINNKKQARKLVAFEIEKVLGVEIKKESIEIKDGVALLRESPIIKNTVFYSKKQILDSLQKIGLKITDIR